MRESNELWVLALIILVLIALSCLKLMGVF